MPKKGVRVSGGAVELEELLELMPDPSAAVDSEGRIVAANSALRGLLGYDAEELLGRPVEILVPEALRTRHPTLRREFSQHPERRAMAEDRKLAARHRDGSAIDVLISLRPLPVAGGTVVVASLRDLTALRRIEAALVESQDRYRDLVENSLDLMCTQDLQGNLLSVNQAAISLTGYSREALLAMNVADLLAPETRSRFGEYLESIRANGQASGLMAIRTATGETRYWQYRNTLRTEGVSVPVVRGMARDVTEARRAKEKLRQSETKYRTVVEHIGEGLLFVDGRETILFANPAVCRMLGYSEAELLGRNAADLLFRDEDQAAMAERNRRRAEGIAEGYEIEVRRKSGEFLWTRFSVAPVTDADGRFSGSMAIIADIAERKQNEALSNGQRRVLEMIAGGAPLAETLTELLRVLEAQSPEMLCSVLLLDPDGKHLRHGAAPSLPADYMRAIDGMAVGPSAGSCGTAAFRRELVIVEDLAADIADDPLWQVGRALAQRHGLRACWSSPVFDAHKNVLGTFAMYYRRPGRPTARHLHLIDVATQTAAIAIGHEHDAAALRRSELQLRSFIEHAPAEMAMFDSDMICLAASQRWIRAYRRGHPTPVGISHYEVNPDLPERWKESHRRGLAGESQACDEDVWVRADGTEQWLRWSVDPWRDPKGSIGGIVIFLEDISARKEAQEAILAEKAFSEAMLDSLPGIFYLIAPGGRLLRWNRSLEKAFGYTAEEAAGMRTLDLVALEDRPRVEETLRKVFTTGAADAEAELVSKDGRRFSYFLTGLRFAVQGEPCCIGTGIDVTARKLLEAELQQAQKIEAIGRLAGGVAHDFNNILGVILGYGELAQSELEPRSPVREHLAEMVKAAERAATLTRQLQAFGRKQVLQPRPLDLNGVIANAHKMLDRLIGEDIVLVLRPAPGLGTVRADPGQIDQILINLAVNARDAMPGGGTLTLETANLEIDDEHAAERWSAKPGRYVMFAVSDTGVGMGAETRRKIFEPFFTTKPAGQGTGLGLATVYGIVTQSGGYIRVDSEPGRGTTFEVLLPRVDERPAPPAAARSVATAPPGGETILLVEDNPALLEVVRRRLEESGYEVLLARDGEEALALAAGHAGPIELLLTDVVMPKMGGGDVAQRLGVLRPGTRVVFMSGHTDGAIAQHGVLEDGVMLLEKPFTGENLLRAVRAAIDRPSERPVEPPEGGGSS